MVCALAVSEIMEMTIPSPPGLAAGAANVSANTPALVITQLPGATVIAPLTYKAVRVICDVEFKTIDQVGDALVFVFR